jgi:hypothetical protein
MKKLLFAAIIATLFTASSCQKCYRCNMPAGCPDAGKYKICEKDKYSAVWLEKGIFTDCNGQEQPCTPL